ncbi:APC family permease [Actinoplanes sp. NPDC051861]|uniref:APC family permease n=1 Tax=Actinoplanes sp. NPDC051861 TaxID=3155170 RepID=UPI00341F0CB9
MPESIPLTGSAPVSTALAADRLSAFEIGAAIASSVAPLTVTAVIVAVATATTGLTGFPIAIILISALLMIFAVGYLAMARHIPNAGAFYAYIAHGIGRQPGVGAAWVALLTYNCFQLCCYGAIGAIASPLLTDWIGFTIPWYLPALIAWLLVAVLGAKEIKLSGLVLMILVAAETVLVVLYSIAIAFGPGFTWNGTALDIGGLSGPTLGVFIVLGATSFAGVEQSVVYIEEARNRLRTIPKATYLTIATIAAVYFLSSWVQISAPGPHILDRAAAEGPDLFFNEAAVVLGQAAVTVGRIFLVTGLIAAALAFHNAITRYTYSLGREGVLPRRFGITTLGGAPRNASLAQTALAFIVLVVYAVLDLDPLVQLFYWGSTTGGLGVLLLYTATSISVIGFFARDTHGENLWRRLLAPLIATGTLLWVSYLAVTNLAALYGVTPGTGPAIVGPIAIAVVFTGGIIWAPVLKTTKPDIYQGIGRGTTSNTTGLATVL